MTDRVKFTYSSNINGNVVEVELPFRVLVLANLSGDERSKDIVENKAINVNRDSIGAVMTGLKCNVAINVPNKLTDEGSLLIEHDIRSMDDFRPESLSANIKELAQIREISGELYNILDNTGGEDSNYYELIKNSESLTPLFDYFEEIPEDIDDDSINFIITELDDRVSSQMDAILHHDDFVAMERVWRSIDFLCRQTNFSENCSIDLFNCSTEGMLEDFEDAPEIVSSKLYELIYAEEFGQYGGKPYSLVIVDELFGSTAQDVWLLQQLASIASMAHCPVLSGAKPQMFDVDSYAELPSIRDMQSLFEQPKYIKLNSLRENPDSRYLGLTVPGFLLRDKYNSDNNHLHYKEKMAKKSGFNGLWGNSAFAMASRFINSYAVTRWCIDSTGNPNGVVEGLQVDNKALGQLVPVQVMLTDKLVSDLNDHGFIPLSLHKADNIAAFYSANSLFKSSAADDTKQSELNDNIASQLPYLFIISRFAHYLKVMQREHLGSWINRSNIEKELNDWVKQYVSDMDNPAPNVRARRPLRKAKIRVTEIEGKDDWFSFNIELIPHLKYMGNSFSLSEAGKLEKN